MQCQVEKDEHFRHLNHGSNTAEAADFYSGDFSQRDIKNILERWEEVLDNNGECIID